MADVTLYARSFRYSRSVSRSVRRSIIYSFSVAFIARRYPFVYFAALREETWPCSCWGDYPIIQSSFGIMFAGGIYICVRLSVCVCVCVCVCTRLFVCGCGYACLQAVFSLDGWPSCICKASFERQQTADFVTKVGLGFGKLCQPV